MENKMEQQKEQQTQANQISFDWKSLRKTYGKDKAGLELFIKDSKNKIALTLIETVKRRGFIQDLLRRCTTQSALNNVILSDDDVWGEVNLVIAALVERWELVCRAEIGKKKIKHSSIDGDLRMHTQNDIVGYFRCSLKNSFADLFTKHTAQKRSANEVTFSNIMSKDADSDDERLFDETIANTSDKELIYKTYISDMIQYLRSYDRENGTRLARLFVALINPRNCGAVIQIQKKLGISNKNFNDHKDVISRLLRAEFGELSFEIISYFEQRKHVFADHAAENKASRKFKNKKKQELEDKKSRPYRMNVIYGQKINNKDKSKSVYYVTIQIDRSKTKSIVAYSTDGWEKVYKKEEKIVGKPGQLDKMKQKLQKLVKDELEEANDLFLKLKNEAKLGI
jgi:hypothetical protein